MNGFSSLSDEFLPLLVEMALLPTARLKNLDAAWKDSFFFVSLLHFFLFDLGSPFFSLYSSTSVTPDLLCREALQ